MSVVSTYAGMKTKTNIERPSQLYLYTLKNMVLLKVYFRKYVWKFALICLRASELLYNGE